MEQTKKTMQLNYGQELTQTPIPGQAKILTLKEPAKSITPAIFKKRLTDFLQTTPLDLTRPVLVVADKTRLCGYPQYLPILIQELTAHGMNPKDLTIIIAYGTHPRQSDEECLHCYGDIYNTVTFIHHDCREINIFTEIGFTSRGTPLRFRKDLLGASAVITMGPICHHYFAGYGGGRKLIFPGCGEREAIYANHGLFLNSTTDTLTTSCQPGVLKGNPLAEDLFEVEDTLVAHLSLHGILDSHGNLCDLLIGHEKNDFLHACARHGENCETPAEKFHTVVASCGGYPKDINFIQSHKAIHNAAMFVEDEGLLLIYAECREGIGSKTFLPWFKKGSFEASFKELSCSYEGNGGTALAMMTKLKRIRIGMITQIDEVTCELIGVERWNQIQVCDYLAGLQKNDSIAFIPNSSLLVQKNEETKEI